MTKKKNLLKIIGILTLIFIATRNQTAVAQILPPDKNSETYSQRLYKTLLKISQSKSTTGKICAAAESIACGVAVFAVPWLPPVLVIPVKISCWTILSVCIPVQIYEGIYQPD